MSELGPSAFDDYVKGLDMSPLRRGRLVKLAEGLGRRAGTLVGYWLKLPAQKRFMIGWLTGAIAANLIWKWRGRDE